MNRMFLRLMTTIPLLSIASQAHAQMSIETDDANSLLNEYYNIALNLGEITNSPQISWEEVDKSGTNTVEVKLPNNIVKYP
ncbi:MAG: hypothetical protein PHE89_06480 [Alphaproteobacteria bacterium]|nr:hypothetical protein [Alphaproteobacteria bacterium]